MKRIRIQLRPFNKKSKVEEEEDQYTRKSPRKRRRVKYIDYDNNDNSDEEEEEEKEEEDDQQLGSSSQSQWIQDNRLLPVTCGNKTGVMDKEKLDRGEPCIKSEDCWYSPPAFEDFGGKYANRKWKASIFLQDKPLQYWFEKGLLTTKGFKKGRRQFKKIISLSDQESESSSRGSEIESEEETEEDDAKDDNWLPNSDELVLEGEEERGGAENGGEGVDSKTDKDKEEDKTGKGELEDEDMSADNNSDSEELEAPEKNILMMELQVILERLPEVKTNQSNYMEHLVDNLSKLSDEEAQSEEESEHSGLAPSDLSITADAHVDPSQMSGPPTTGGVTEENKAEFIQRNERKDRQGGTETDQRDSSRSPSAPATSSSDIEPDTVHKTEDSGRMSNHTAKPSAFPQMLLSGTDTDVGSDIVGDWEEKDAELQTGQCGTEQHEGSSETFVTVNTGGVSVREPIHIKTERTEETKLSTIPSSELVECKYENPGQTDATTSGHHAAQSQVTTPQTRFPLTAGVSGRTRYPENPSSATTDLDTMDLDQLKKEKIKMQLKVLKLQEEYYTLKIHERRKCHRFPGDTL
uniref:SAND domain-containing protein n=1 Tax=Monopterus albus TaxID=43700 RepID=A0A3Q3K8G0_MONAL|nr:uncharacterized protein LOC109958848 [Monopterus albus]XP_020453444.1 uncharacterized protein LOC109958848 [Monopterus albus]XP_020453445.1 uncharacterized protein LOC109958848 [Monopterus albus]